MIKALAAAAPDRRVVLKASRQKKDALFEMAGRIALIAEESRLTQGKALAAAAKAERRKPLRAGLGLVAGGTDAETLDRGLERDFPAPDQGLALELRLVRVGLRGILAGEHPFVLMRRLCAILGPEYHEKASVWMLSRVKRRRYRPDSLVVPGELPDLLRSLALAPPSLEKAVRGAGREIAAGALAGCPQESIDLVKPLFGTIGGVVLEDDAAFLRSKLSGDEIAQAQAAFIEIARSLEEAGELDVGDFRGTETDPAFVAELTKAIMSADERILKQVLRSSRGCDLVDAMQGMEPRAHDRILGVLTKKEERLILDAIDDSNPLSRLPIMDAGKELAASLRAALKASKTGKAEELERLTRLCEWPG
jgi:hypothetical protein